MMSSVSFLIGYSVAIFQFHGNIYLHLWRDSIVKTLLLLVVLASFSMVAWWLDISIGQLATVIEYHMTRYHTSDVKR